MSSFEATDHETDVESWKTILTFVCKESRGAFHKAFFQSQMTKISDNSADNQSEARILVAYNKNCHLSLMTSFVKRPPEECETSLKGNQNGTTTDSSETHPARRQMVNDCIQDNMAY